MADRDEIEDAVDGLSWPDTTRPIVSNSMPQSPAPATWPTASKPPAYTEEPRSVSRIRRRRWVALVIGFLILAALVVLLVIWLL